MGDAVEAQSLVGMDCMLRTLVEDCHPMVNPCDGTFETWKDVMFLWKQN